MELEKVRIDLGNGDYADILKQVLRVTSRLHTAELKRHLKPVEITGKDGNGKLLLSELDRDTAGLKMDYVVDLASVDDDVINEIYILNQVTEWSFCKIDRPNGVLHNAEEVRMALDYKMTRDQYKILVGEMDRLYKPLP